VRGDRLEERLDAVSRVTLAVGRMPGDVSLQVAPQHDHGGPHVEELHAEHPLRCRALDDTRRTLLVRVRVRVRVGVGVRVGVRVST